MMTGWLGVNDVNSCCCCELCQPVRCIIDQHEVEIVPATYRSSNSSLAPSTQRSQWSSSSNNTLPSSRTLISEGSIPSAHTHYGRRPDPATYYASSVDTYSLSKPTCRHSSHGHWQSASKDENHNSHTSSVAANIDALHQNRQQQSITHVNITASGQECTGSRRLALATKKLGSEKTSHAGEKLEEHRMQTGSAKDSAAALCRGTTRARASEKPFQLFEQDPQHHASFPDGYRVIHAQQPARSVPLGTVFASALVRARRKLPHAVVNVRPIAGEGPDHMGQFKSEPSSDVRSPVNANHSRNASGKRNNCNTSSRVSSVPTSRVLQSVQISRLELNGPHLSGKPAVCLGGQKSELMPELFPGVSGLSACAVLTSSRPDHNKGTPVTRDLAGRGFIDTNIRSGCHCSVATKGTFGKDGGGNPQSGDTVEDEAAAVPVSGRANLRKGNAGPHGHGVKLQESFSRAPRDSTTTATAVAAVDMESDARQCIRTLHLSRALQMLENFTIADGPTDVRVASHIFPQGASACSDWSGCGTAASEVQAGTVYKDNTDVFSHDLKASGGTLFSGLATAAAFPGTCITSCSGRPMTSQKRKNPPSLEPLSRESHPWTTRSVPECELFFYDSSISCADGLACNSVASYASADGWIAADVGSALDAAGPISDFWTDTQDGSNPHRGKRKSCLAKDRRQPHQQEETSLRIQPAGLAGIAETTTGIASTRKRSAHDPFLRRAFCTLWKASVEARQERKQNPRLGWSASDPDDVVSTAVFHASRLERGDWQQEHRLYSAALEEQTLLNKGQQLDQIQQLPKEGNASPGGRRRKLSTARKVPLMIKLTKGKLEMENTTGNQNSCRSAIPFSRTNVIQQYTDGANLCLPPANAQVIPRENKRKKQVCHPLACPQGRQHPPRRHENCSRTRRKSGGAKDNSISGIYDKWRFRRNQGICGRGVTNNALVNKCTTSEGRNSTAPTRSTLCRLCPSSVSAQRKEVSSQSQTGQAGSRVCYGVTPFIYSLVASSTACLSAKNSLRQNSAQQQHEQLVCSEWQQRCRCSQQRDKGAPKSSTSSQDGCTLYAQSHEAPALYTLPAEVAESMGTRVTSLSSFSTEVLRTPTPRPPSSTYHVQRPPSQADSQNIKNSEDTSVGSELSGSSDRNPLCCIRTTSTANTITSDSSDSIGNRGGMTMFVTRSSGSKRGSRDNALRCTSMVTTESNDEGAYFTDKTKRRISTAQRSKYSAVCRSIEARLVPRGSTAALTAFQCRDDACACPVFSDSFSIRYCDLEKPSSHRSTLKPYGSTQLLKSGGTCRFPVTASRCFRNSVSAPITPSATPGTLTSYEVAEAPSVLKRNSLLSSVDKDTLLPRRYTRAQEPRGKSGVEERRSYNEDNPDRLRCRRSLGSKGKCISKELSHGLLSKAARLVLWQAKTHLSSPPAEAQLLIS